MPMIKHGVLLLLKHNFSRVAAKLMGLAAALFFTVSFFSCKSAQQELDLQKLIAENASLKEELSARRQEQQQTYVPKPLDLSEYKTRKLYIDSMLMDAGWTEGKDWLNEVELPGMPNKAGVGFADYVLYDDAHRPLTVIEAKRGGSTTASPAEPAQAVEAEVVQ